MPEEINIIKDLIDTRVAELGKQGIHIILSIHNNEFYDLPFISLNVFLMLVTSWTNAFLLITIFRGWSLVLKLRVGYFSGATLKLSSEWGVLKLTNYIKELWNWMEFKWFFNQLFSAGWISQNQFSLLAFSWAAKENSQGRTGG